MEKKINKKKIVKYAAAGLLTVALVGTGIELHLYDSNIDHLNEYCPLNNVLGAQHQVHEVNNKYAVYGINAFYTANGEVQLVSAPMKKEIDGKIVYMAPSGYVLSDGKAVKTIKYTDVEKAIVITEGTLVYPEGAQLEDLIKKADIQVYDPKVVKVITANQETETIDEETYEMKLAAPKKLSR